MEEKKESWIETLIELLNEYVKELWIWDYVWWHNKKTVENSDYIITKKFWFIKWLVDNDKIDFSNLKIEEIVAWTDLYYSFKKDEVLLMLLSIQDDPIEFLVSILK